MKGIVSAAVFGFALFTCVAAPIVVIAGSGQEQAECLSCDPRDALRQAGVSSYSKGALSNIVIRGYQKENLSVTFDGAPYFGAVPFRVDAAPFLLQNIDVSRIIVTKGPYNQMVPGAAGGSIDIISPPPPRRLSAKGALAYGSYDAVDGKVSLGAGNDKADVAAGYRGRVSDVPEAGDGVPFTRTAYPNPANNYRPGSEHLDMYRLNTVWLAAGVNPGTDSRIDMRYEQVDGDDIKVPTMNFDVPSVQVHRLQGRIAVRNVTAAIRELSAQGWWSRSKAALDDSLRETSDPLNPALPYRSSLTRPYAMSNLFVAETLGGRAAASIAAGQSVVKTGVDYYERRWNATYSSLLRIGTPQWSYYDKEPLIPDVTTKNLGFYAILDRPLATGVRAVVSARGDVSRIDADGLTAARIVQMYHPYYEGEQIPTERTFADWSGSIQLFWKIDPTLELYLKGGQGNRLPDPHELYTGQIRSGSNLVGNPYLKQTVTREADVGGTWTAGGSRFDLSLFYSRADDFVIPVRREATGSGMQPARSAENIDAVIWGIEAEGSLALPGSVKLAGMICYTEGSNRTTGGALAEMPPLRGRVGLQYDDRRLFAGIAETMVARQDRYDPMLNETAMPGYAVTDLTAGFRLKALTVTAAVNNLLDARYVQPLSYQRDPITMAVRIPESGRNVMLSATYRF